jgi:hypothetical protein
MMNKILFLLHSFCAYHLCLDIFFFRTYLALMHIVSSTCDWIFTSSAASLINLKHIHTRFLFHFVISFDNYRSNLDFFFLLFQFKMSIDSSASNVNGRSFHNANKGYQNDSLNPYFIHPMKILHWFSLLSRSLVEIITLDSLNDCCINYAPRICFTSLIWHLSSTTKWRL